MKRLSLDKTWEQCLKMWRWIVRQSCPRDIVRLKERWIKNNGFNNIEDDCFFCNYANQYSGCEISCPGNKIDRDFTCFHNNYHYAYDSAAFLRKITELNRIRLAKKGKK